MTFGLDPKAIQLIERVFLKFPAVEKVCVFGSRAMGKERENSDIDLVIWGSLDDETFAKLNAELDELPLPYTFDIQLYNMITSEPLKEHIKKFGKAFPLRKN